MNRLQNTAALVYVYVDANKSAGAHWPQRSQWRITGSSEVFCNLPAVTERAQIHKEEFRTPNSDHKGLVNAAVPTQVMVTGLR